MNNYIEKGTSSLATYTVSIAAYGKTHIDIPKGIFESTMPIECIINVGGYAEVTINHPTEYNPNVHITYIINAALNSRTRLYVNADTIHTLIVELRAHGEQADVYAMITHRLQGTHALAITTKQIMHAAKSSTAVFVRGIIDDQAHLNYHGTIIVNRNAYESHAIQEQKALLLGLSARCTATPSLEVHTNKVHCKHGSAIGKLSQEQLAYLALQGIDMVQAREMIINGFMHE